MNSRATKPFVIGAALLLAATASCGTGESEGDGPETDPVTVIQGVDPSTMDPLQQTETTTENVLRHLYDPLVERDTNDTTQFVGVLAESWERPDDLTLRLELKEGVEFSDGSAFTAADVKYTVDYLLGDLPGMDPTLQAPQMPDISSADAVDDFTVEIKTTRPSSLLLAQLANLFIVPEGSVDEDPAALASQPIGTGPYSFVRWDRNSQVVMEAKENYHRGAPAIGEIIFKTITEPSSRLAALMAGQADLITAVTANEAKQIEASDRTEVKSVPSTRTALIWLNTENPGALQSAKVRQALNHAIDVEALVQNVMGGQGTPLATWVPEYFEGYNPDVEPLEYNPQLARQLLAEAGYPDGFEFEILAPTGRYPYTRDLTQAIVAHLAEVGVDLKVDLVDFAIYGEATQTGEIKDGLYGAWGNSLFSPLELLNVAVISEGQFSWYSNERVDKLNAEASVTFDQDVKTDLFTEIQETLLADPPFIYLFAFEDIYGVSERLQWEPSHNESVYLYEAELRG